MITSNTQQERHQATNRFKSIRMAISPRFQKLSFSNPLIQLLLVGIFGIILGGYVLVANFFSYQLILAFLLLLLSGFVLVVFKDLRKLLLAIILFEMTFIIDINLFYDPVLAEQRVSFAGLNISLTTILLGILYGIWILEKASGIQKERLVNFRLMIPGLLYVLFVGLSIIVAQNRILASYHFFVLVQAFLLFFYLVHHIQSEQDMRIIMMILIVALFLESVIIIFIGAVGQSFSLGPVSAGLESPLRVSGTLGHPNGAASHLTLLIAPAIGFVLIARNGWFKLFTFIALILGLGALMLTGSRGGWIAVGVSVSLLSLVALKRRWMKLSSLIFIISAIGMAYFVFQNSIMLRIFGDDSGSALSRLPLMQIALNIIGDNPLFGVGVNNFILSVREYLTPEFAESYRSVVHNKYLLIWSETGIFALLSFVTFLITLIYVGWRSSFIQNKLVAAMTIGFTAALIGQMTHMAVARFTGRPQIFMFWMVAGIISAAYTIGQRDNLGTLAKKKVVG